MICYVLLLVLAQIDHAAVVRPRKHGMVSIRTQIAFPPCQLRDKPDKQAQCTSSVENAPTVNVPSNYRYVAAIDMKDDGHVRGQSPRQMRLDMLTEAIKTMLRANSDTIAFGGNSADQIVVVTSPQPGGSVIPHRFRQVLS